MLKLFKNPGARLDASESMHLKRELEYVETETYRNLYAALQARDFVPTKPGIPEWARTITWREMDEFGKAKIISNASDDLPRSNVKRTETGKTIKTIGMSYGYDWEELAASAAMGTHLDAEEANAAAFAVDSELDEILSYGNETYGLDGVLTIGGVTDFTPSTKTAGGKLWGSLSAPNATGLEVANDLMGLAQKGHETSKGRVAKFRLVVPIEQYGYAAQTPISATYPQMTALKYALENSPFISSITPWWRCDSANSGGKLSYDALMAIPEGVPAALQGIVPMERRTLPAQQKNLSWIVPIVAKCGGVVSKYPFLMVRNTEAV
jgi:hypothetical protein